MMYQIEVNAADDALLTDEATAIGMTNQALLDLRIALYFSSLLDAKALADTQVVVKDFQAQDATEQARRVAATPAPVSP